MRITSIQRKEEQGKIIKIEEALFQKDQGLVGDKNSKGGDKQVSIFTKEGRAYLEKENLKGLCTHRFYENLTIQDLDIAQLQVGQRIRIGATVQEITYIGKSCFPECNLLQSKKKCPLVTAVIFTKVIKTGIVKVGDVVEFQ